MALHVTATAVVAIRASIDAELRPETARVRAAAPWIACWTPSLGAPGALEATRASARPAAAESARARREGA